MKARPAWYIVSMVVVGLTIGYLVALSRSPVIGVLLPLLFGLIAGGSGIFLAREDLTQQAGRQRLNFLGVSISALSGGLLISSAITLFFVPRTPSPNEDFLIAVEGKQLGAAELLQLAEARAVAIRLGLSEREQKLVLQRGASELSLSTPSAANVRAIVRSNEGQLRRTRDAISGQDRSSLPPNLTSRLAILENLLQAIIFSSASSVPNTEGLGLPLMLARANTETETILQLSLAQMPNLQILPDLFAAKEHLGQISNAVSAREGRDLVNESTVNLLRIISSSASGAPASVNSFAGRGPSFDPIAELPFQLQPRPM